MKRYEARLSGLGGQGVILAGIILAEAAGIHEGRKVVQTQSYGPESRGSACKCDVIIGDQEIKYPGVYRLNLLVALSQDACDKYAGELVEGGLLIYDPLYVQTAAGQTACAPTPSRRPRSPRAWGARSRRTWWRWAPWRRWPTSSPPSR